MRHKSGVNDLTSSGFHGIVNIEKDIADKRLVQISFYALSIRNRHLAEWRFLLFTVIVIVHPRM